MMIIMMIELQGYCTGIDLMLVIPKDVEYLKAMSIHSTAVKVFHLYHRCQPHGSARRKIWESPKSLGLILWGP